MLTKLIQLSQNYLILQAVPPLGTWARGPLCLEIHALKNPTNYKHMNTKRLQDHISTSLLRIRFDFNSKRAFGGNAN